MTYQTFRTEEGARLFSIQQRQVGFYTAVIYWSAPDRWEVRSWA